MWAPVWSENRSWRVNSSSSDRRRGVVAPGGAAAAVGAVGRESAVNGAWSVAGGAAGGGEAAGGRDDLPFVAAGVERHLDDSVRAALSHLAVGANGAERVEAAATGSDYEL